MADVDKILGTSYNTRDNDGALDEDLIDYDEDVEIPTTTSDPQQLADTPPKGTHDGHAKVEVDEIDYEDDDDGVEEQSNHRSVILSNNAESTLPQDLDGVAGEVDEDQLAQDEAGVDDLERPADGDENQEVAWEDNGGEAPISDHERDPRTQSPILSDEANPEYLSRDQSDSGRGNAESRSQLGSSAWHEDAKTTQATHEEASAPNESIDQAHGHPEGHIDDADDDYAELDYASADEQELRQSQIIVSYKGEDFPLVSASPDAFFTDSSVQDFPIRDLLSHFRDVLGDEVGAMEELVYRIDELGLEFSETSPPDLIASTTLRGILDIFDILVHNQDPATSRALYTYLHARPNTARRLDYLAESAANGQGLDEIMCLLEPSTDHASSTNRTIDEGEEGHNKQQADEEETDNMLGYSEGVDNEHEVGKETNGSSLSSLDGNAQPKPSATSHAAEVGESIDASGPVGEAVEVDFVVDSEHVTDGATFEDDKIDFSLGDETLTLEEELESPYIEAPRTVTASTTTIAEAASSLDDEVDFSLSAPAPKLDEDMLSEIDWQDPTGADELVRAEISTPSSAVKRSHSEDETNVHTESQQDAKRPRFEQTSD